jgi:PAS domain S-box-containing protein
VSGAIVDGQAAELERRRIAEENTRLASELRSSVRELKLLHDVIRIIQQDDRGAATDWQQQIADAVREQWPVPWIAWTRIGIGSVVRTSGEINERQMRHRSVFSVSDGRTGTIEIAFEPRPDTDRLALLDALAEMIRSAVERRCTLTALRRSEERYHSVIDRQSEMVCRFLADTTLTFVNQAYCRFFAQQPHDLIGVPFITLIPEEARGATLRHIAALQEGMHPQAYEHSVLLPDGSRGRHQWINFPIRSANGAIHEFHGIGHDITDRWRAEEALRGKEARLRHAYQRIRSLAQRLILAQEAERTEIARDLHDDVSQQLAAVSIELTVIEKHARDGVDITGKIARLRQLATELTDKVRRTSHALHPGVLKHAGLAAALASHCDSVTSQHSVVVTFEPQGRFDDVSEDLALCLYRVAQQALRNVVMHAEATCATVTLVRCDETIEMLIADDGRGFDPARAHVSGIGLMSIEERVGAVRGTLSVDSTRGGGARLHIQVPVGRQV